MQSLNYSKIFGTFCGILIIEVFCGNGFVIRVVLEISHNGKYSTTSHIAGSWILFLNYFYCYLCLLCRKGSLL